MKINCFILRVQYKDGTGMNDDGCIYRLKFIRFIAPSSLYSQGAMQFELLPSDWTRKFINIPLNKNIIEYLNSNGYYVYEFIDNEEDV